VYALRTGYVGNNGSTNVPLLELWTAQSSAIKLMACFGYENRLAYRPEEAGKSRS
jgi:hypothetical protein